MAAHFYCQSWYNNNTPHIISNKIHLSPSDKVGNCIYDVNVTCNNIKTIVLFV